MTYSYCNTSVLALNIKNFQASLVDNDVSVKWTTQNEIKNNFYEIQVSENGAAFQSIGTKKSSTVDGSSAEYSYKYHFDKSPAGKLYVRIKQVDGKTTRYSQIKALLAGEKTMPSLSIYPNPVVRNINLQFDEPLSGDYNIELANQVGQIVLRKRVRLNNNMTMEIQVDDPPTPGIYYLRAMEAGSRKVYSGKLLFRR